MATVQEIANDIKVRFGCVLSQNQVRQYIGVGSDKVREMLSDVPYLQDTQTKRYFAVDVAQKLFSMQVDPKEQGRPKPPEKGVD